MRILEKILFTFMMLTIVAVFLLGKQISSPIVSASLCTSMIAVLLNRFIINIKDEN